jgi:hypothetical protein
MKKIFQGLECAYQGVTMQGGVEASSSSKKTCRAYPTVQKPNFYNNTLDVVMSSVSKYPSTIKNWEEGTFELSFLQWGFEAKSSRSKGETGRLTWGRASHVTSLLNSERIGLTFVKQGFKGI